MLIAENASLAKQVDSMMQSMMQIEKRSICESAETMNGVQVIKSLVKPMFVAHLKDIAFQLRAESDKDMVAILGGEADGKPQIAVILSESLTQKINAVELIRAVSSEINGGGGGQPFFAPAGGKNPQGIDSALSKALSSVKEKLA